MIRKLACRDAWHFPEELLIIIMGDLLFVNHRGQAVAHFLHNGDFVLLPDISQSCFGADQRCANEQGV